MHSMHFPLTSLCKASYIQQCNYGYKEAAGVCRSEEKGKKWSCCERVRPSVLRRRQIEEEERRRMKQRRRKLWEANEKQRSVHQQNWLIKCTLTTCCIIWLFLSLPPIACQELNVFTATSNADDASTDQSNLHLKNESWKIPLQNHSLVSSKRPSYRFDSQLLSCTQAGAHKHTCTTRQPVSQSSSAFRPGVSEPKAGTPGLGLCLCPCVHHGCTLLFINYSNTLTQSHFLTRAVPPCCQGCGTEPDHWDLSVLIISLGLRSTANTHTHSHTLLSLTRYNMVADVSNWTLCFQSSDHSPQQAALMKKQCTTLEEIKSLTNQVCLRRLGSSIVWKIAAFSNHNHPQEEVSFSASEWKPEQ